MEGCQECAGATELLDMGCFIFGVGRRRHVNVASTSSTRVFLKKPTHMHSSMSSAAASWPGGICSTIRMRRITTCDISRQAGHQAGVAGLLMRVGMLWSMHQMSPWPSQSRIIVARAAQYARAGKLSSIVDVWIRRL
eukprot:366001-Chlamydomonas_euryale.AAC.5